MTSEGRKTRERKRDHLDLFRRDGAAARHATTWLECVHLVHQALPEFDVADIDLRTSFAGRPFRAPLFITGMTGGTVEATAINRALAKVADDYGFGLGLGSQRAMLEDPRIADSYRVRPVAPRVFLAGNLGAVQAAATPVRKVRQMLRDVGAEALFVHLNPAHEMLQPEGDREFTGVLRAIGTLVHELDVPVIIKETGAGLSREVALRLRSVGVRHLDVAGTGGTSWAGAEIKRRNGEADPHLASFWDWGIPTAAALSEVEGLRMEVIGSGGIRTGLDVARSIRLGARLAGVAAPLLTAYFKGGERMVRREIDAILDGLRTAMVLAGSRTLAELGKAPAVILGDLLEWRRQRPAKKRRADRS